MTIEELSRLGLFLCASVTTAIVLHDFYRFRRTKREKEALELFKLRLETLDLSTRLKHPFGKPEFKSNAWPYAQGKPERTLSDGIADSSVANSTEPRSGVAANKSNSRQLVGPVIDWFVSTLIAITLGFVAFVFYVFATDEGDGVSAAFAVISSSMSIAAAINAGKCIGLIWSALTKASAI
ncbi:MAG: hypothetical protein AAFY29_22945 [Pseudomonadota bacterium]